jgi:acyl-CoA synthetase (AMP-forming)/AMP-acid ligase II/NAD(P)-dependent dehydrogenase (short-subunit alcohol dehydrogenase family)
MSSRSEVTVVDECNWTTEPTAAQSLELALRSLPGIIDARVLEIAPGTAAPGRRAPRRIAYLAGPGALSPLPEGFAHAHRLDHVVAVTRLGDEAALAALPVWDAAAHERLTSEFRTREGVADAAVATIARSASRFLMRSRLTPDFLPRRNEPEGSTETASDRADIGARLSDRAAIVEGGPLVMPPGHPKTLSEALERAARTSHGVVYLADDGSARRESYAELRRRALSILGGLHRAGVKAGDILLLDSGDAHGFLGAFWACMLGGIVAAPIALPQPGADPAALQRLRAVWEMLDRPRLVASPSMTEALAARPAETDDMAIHDMSGLHASAPAEATPATNPDDTAVIILTSGSTGTPKGVRQRHAAILAMSAAAGVEGLHLRAGQEIFFNWMPLDHVGGFVFLICVPVILACDQVHSATAPILADPLRWVELVSRHRVSISWAPNFAFGLIGDAVAGARAVARPWDLSCLRILINGGEAVTESSLIGFLDSLAPWGLPRGAMRPSFGMSETCAPVTLAELGHSRGPFVSLGPPVAGSALRIAGDDGQILKEGEIGKLQLTGPQLFAGYHGCRDLTEAAVRDGWFETGDVGFVAEGHLYLTGRIKDSINVNGAKFFAHEIEAVAARTPGIDRAGVAAVPVRPRGARTDSVAVFFSARLANGTADDDVLRALIMSLRGRLAKGLGLAVDYLLPVATREIPRTGIGKILRKTLQQRFAEGTYNATVERVAGLLGGPESVPLRLHRKTWIEREMRANPGAAAAIQVLFASDDGLPDRLPAPAGGRRLRVIRAPRSERHDDATWHLAPGDAHGHAALIATLLAEEGRIGTILHLWGCEAGNDDDAYRSLLALGRAIAALPPEQRPDAVLAVTTGAACVQAGDGIVADRALVPGLIRSLNLELPRVRWRTVDLLESDPDTLAGVVDSELGGGAEPEVAWRSGCRYVARFEAVNPTAPANRAPPVRRDSLWLVTGGLGGLGRVVSAWLLSKGARLLLIGRTAPARLSVERAAALRQLEARGHVRYVAADVGDADALARAVADMEADAGRPLDGMLHLAGLGRAVRLSEDDASELPAMRRAALDGLDSLKALLTARPGASLTIVGSIAGRVGGHVVGYAAVNAAAAEAAAALIAAGARVSHLAFSSWSGVGMSEGHTTDTLLRSDGLHALDEATGLAALEGALWRPGTSWLVGLDDDHPLHAALTLGDPAPLTRPVAWLAGDAAESAEQHADALGRPGWVLIRPAAEIPRHADGTPDLRHLVIGDTGERLGPRDETERLVAEIFAEVLSIEALAINDDFFVAGGTSLLATRLAARLSRRFFLDLPVGAVFQHPTVEGLTRQLRARETKPGLVDAIARQLAVIESLSTSEREAMQTQLGD